MISEDEYLERIVAGIHAVTTEGADVHWNEVINGRQFDVVVRFSIGTLSYLVLIEVKNKARKASAEDLDAFVTKARDQLASKAVFVTAAGFQKGAIDTARRHGVELFTVRFDKSNIGLSPKTERYALLCGNFPPGVKPTLEISDPEPVLTVAHVDLIYADRSRYAVPDEQSQMNYYLAKTLLDDGSSLEALVQRLRFPDIAMGERRKELVRLKPARRITPPDDYYYPVGKIVSLDCEITVEEAHIIRGNIRIEPGSFQHPVIYTNVLTGMSSKFAIDELPLGGIEIRVGDFYMLLHPLRYYQCADVTGTLVTWHLIESFQNGQLTRSTYMQELIYAVHYIPVGDAATKARLQDRLADYLHLTGKGPPRLPRSFAAWKGRWKRTWLSRK